LVGYSFGACIAPFVVERLPVTLKKSLNSVYCLSPDKTGDFEIHIRDMINFRVSKGTYNVVQEMSKIKSFHPVCFFGDKKSIEMTKIFSAAGAKIIILHGDHNYNENASGVVVAIINEVKNLDIK
jgi:type IV secretory pathway VirJ component